MKKLFLVIFFTLPFLFTACQKDFNPPSNPAPDSTKEITVPQDFKWKTSKDIQLSVKGNANGMVQILSSEGKVYWKVFVSANQTSTIDLNIPSYESSLQLKYQGQTVSLELTSNTLNYEFQ